MRIKQSDHLMFYVNDQLDRDYLLKLQNKATEAGVRCYVVPVEGQAYIQVQRPPDGFGPSFQLGPKTIAWLNATLDLLICKNNSKIAKQKLNEIMRDPKLQPERLSFAGAMI